MSAWFVGGKDAPVQGEGDLDLGFVGYPGDGCGAGGEGGHFGGVSLFCGIWWRDVVWCSGECDSG